MEPTNDPQAHQVQYTGEKWWYSQTAACTGPKQCEVCRARLRTMTKQVFDYAKATNFDIGGDHA